MNTLGSYTAKEDVTHFVGVFADGFGINNLSTVSVTGTTFNTGVPTLSNHGYDAIVTTATSNVIFQLDIPYVVGVRKVLHCATLANTSIPALVYAGSTAFEACFLTVAGNTSNSMATLYKGAVLELLAVSTNKWLVTGNCTAGSTAPVSFSSST